MLRAWRESQGQPMDAPPFVPRAEVVACPCCGKPMEVDKPNGLALLPMSIMQLTILKRLIKAYPDSVATDRMQDHVYSGVREPPVSMSSIIAVQMTRLRLKLRRHGWAIPVERGGRGNHARYRLVKVKEMPDASA
jgi:hypothetical protein